MAAYVQHTRIAQSCSKRASCIQKRFGPMHKNYYIYKKVKKFLREDCLKESMQFL